jgi:hypothetical protein
MGGLTEPTDPQWRSTQRIPLGHEDIRRLWRGSTPCAACGTQVVSRPPAVDR